MKEEDSATRLSNLKKDLSELQSQAAVAKAERTRLTKELKEQLDSLKELGYSSFDEAKKGVEDLEAQVQKMFEEAESSVTNLRSKFQ